jgi:hypothetical protein
LNIAKDGQQVCCKGDVAKVFDVHNFPIAFTPHHHFAFSIVLCMDAQGAVSSVNVATQSVEDRAQEDVQDLPTRRGKDKESFPALSLSIHNNNRLQHNLYFYHLRTELI